MNKTKAIVFFGIVIIGLIISIYSLNKFGKSVEAPGEKTEPEKVAEVPASKKSNPPAAKPQVTKASPEKPTPPKAAPKPPVSAGMPIDSKAKRSPQALMSALSKEIAAKDYEGFLKSVGEKAVPKVIRPRLKAVIENPGLDIDAKQPYSEISKSAEAMRWAINLVPNTGNASTVQIYTDLKKMGPTSFDVINVAFPLDLTAPAAANPADPKMAKKNGAKPVSPDAVLKPDALTVAHAFAKAVVAKKFKTARSLADSKNVTDERVAALMIAIEEGKFSLKEERPLIVTLARDEITWVLTRLHSDEQTSEFALELGKVGNDWKVNGLTFSKVIASLANRAGAGNVVYTPFVTSPEGGDSLVLYFEFDNAGVTPRTARQLAVVANILKGDPSRKIVISGHADALGSDDYNAKLSDGRAASIRSTLIAEGAKPEQIITRAYGESKPRSPNFNPDGSDNPRGRSENRRAEVYLDF